MTTRPVVILVHGMGKHEQGNITQEYVSSLDISLKLIDGYANKSIADLVDIVEIHYDSFFNEVREKMADTAKPMEQRLSVLSQTFNFSWAPDLVTKLTSFESKYKDDESFYTHWLDVIFYTTVLGGKVRVDAAKEIATAFARIPQQSVHIVAHSLGTAVIHDTLAQLYRGDFNSNDNIPDLDLITHRLKSVWMLANVSRMVNTVNDISDPYRSCVKPTQSGCSDYMYNVRHELDPFTWLRQFNPSNDGSWIPSDYYGNEYKNIETSAVSDFNTHSFSEYLRNPKVSLPMLQRLLRLYPTEPEREAIREQFDKTTIGGAYEDLKESLKVIDIDDSASLTKFVKTAKQFKDVADTLKGTIPQ